MISNQGQIMEKRAGSGLLAGWMEFESGGDLI